jgi:hypothetical protein
MDRTQRSIDDLGGCHCHARSGTISEVTDALAEDAAGLSAIPVLPYTPPPLQSHARGKHGGRTSRADDAIDWQTSKARYNLQPLVEPRLTSPLTAPGQLTLFRRQRGQCEPDLDGFPEA